jgi:hypothetical protein
MSKRSKALQRLLSKPNDLTWDELESVMTGLGYELKTSGGSSRKFARSGMAFFIHEPHPQKILKPYQVRGVLEFLRRQGDIE